MTELVCSDRGQHRPIILLRWKGPTPVQDWWAQRAANNWLEWPRQPGTLACRRCPRNPRLRAERVGALLEVASHLPDGRLDLSMLDL
jgi:hypothetical protein